MNIGHDCDQEPDGGDREPLISEVVGDGATGSRRQVVQDLVTRAILRRTLQKQHGKASKDGDRDPIVDSFQFRFPVRVSCG